MTVVAPLLADGADDPADNATDGATYFRALSLDGRKAVKKFMDKPNRFPPCSNLTIAKLKLCYLIPVAALNITSLSFFLLASYPEKCVPPLCKLTAYGDFFRMMYHIVAWSELLVVCFFLLRAIANFILVGCMVFLHGNQDHGHNHVHDMVHNLRRAGSFSMLRFLPLPIKLNHWHNNFAHYYDAIMNPRVLVLVPIAGVKELWNDGKTLFSPFAKDSWKYCQEYWKQYGCIAGFVSYLFRVIVWFVLKVVVPPGILVCCVLSVFSLLIKLAEGAPANYNLDQWTPSEWLMVLGVANNFSKMWDTQEYELLAVIRFLTMLTLDLETDECDESERVEEGMRKVSHILRLAHSEGLGYEMSALLDSGSLAIVLNYENFEGRGKSLDEIFKGASNFRSNSSLVPSVGVSSTKSVTGTTVV